MFDALMLENSYIIFIKEYLIAVSIATGYGPDDQERREFESQQGKKFSLLHIVQTGAGVHPTSYKMGTGGSFPGVKRQGR
jgi:hypothetical protein